MKVFYRLCGKRDTRLDSHANIFVKCNR